MLESRARQWIAALPSLSATDWYEHLLIRRGALPPELLPLLGWLKSLGGSPPPAPHLAALQAALRLQDLPQPPDAGGRPLPWAEAPWLQVRRVAAAVLAGHGDWTPPPGLAAVAGLAGVAEAAAIDDPHGAALGHGHPAQHDILPDWTPAQAAYIAQSATWAAAWLQAAAALGPGHQPPFGNWLPPAVLASVQLPVARLDEWDQGLPASLTLFRLHQPGAGLCLAPAPASAALLRCGTAWDAALADLRQQITALLGPAAAPLLRDTAIAWDLAGVGDSPLGIVSGPSLSAAMALGTLWLLREAVPPPLQANLARLDRRHLATVAVTAALGPQPELELLPVDGTLGKAAALQALATAMARYPQHPDAGTLVLHVSQHQALPVVTGSVPGQVPHRGSLTLGALVQHLAELADPLSPDQTTLLQSLLAPGDQAPHLADDGLLQRVYDAPVHTLRQYLLHAWATYERLLGGQVHQRFVPLAVRPDAAGFAYPQLLDGLHGDFDDGVRQVLGKLDGSGVQAYLLRGAPGAGKSTLLRHHLQHSARHALRALSLPAAALSPQDGPPELPLVLSLNGLAPGADPATWLQQQLAAHPPALAALLCDQGDWAQQGLRARVMLDGLNELQVAHADQRPARAQQVVQAVLALRQAHKPRGEPLPLLLSIREHHASRLTGLLVLVVDVKPWEVAQIQRYLALRFALDGDQGLRRLQALQAMPDALALCRRPMYLALLCDLLEDGFGAAQGDSAALPGNRAALYAAWLWGALRRALNGNPRHRAHDDPALWDEAPGAGADAVLLTAADRAAILSDSAWRAGRLHQLPQQGQLLRCLMQQAEDQWWAGAGAADSRAKPAAHAEPAPEAERSAAPVPWASVAKGLPEPLRQRLGHAAATLGVATLDEGFSTWRFAHQSWAEYLASCRLLRAGVPLSPQLLGRLHAVPPPFDSDEAQVQALAGGGPAWREVPQALWDRLLKEEIGRAHV